MPSYSANTITLEEAHAAATARGFQPTRLGSRGRFSFNSRAWGMLPRGNIIGKAWFSYFPFNEAGIVTSHDPIP